MADIVERLEDAAAAPDCGFPKLTREAADEIERLRAALKKINVGEGWAAQIARAALEASNG